jgi:hypothetical protein
MGVRSGNVTMRVAMSRSVCVGMTVTGSRGTSLWTARLVDRTSNRRVVSVSGVTAERRARHRLVVSRGSTGPVLKKLLNLSMRVHAGLHEVPS